MLELQALQNAPEWSRMSVPEIPSAEDVDCNIEVEVVSMMKKNVTNNCPKQYMKYIDRINCA